MIINNIIIYNDFFALSYNFFLLFYDIYLQNNNLWAF